MNIKKTLKQNWIKIIFHILFLTISTIVLFFSSKNIGRAIFIQISLIIWLFLLWRNNFKNIVYPSIIYFVLVLPFNVTIRIPQNVFGMTLYNPFVLSVRIPYLIPVISILDLAFGLIVFSLLTYYVRNNVDLKVLISELRKYKFLFFGLLISLTLNFTRNLMSFSDLNIIWKSFRFLLGVSIALLLSRYLIIRKISKKLKSQLLTILLFTTFIQVSIALYQFLNGHSIGADFLGESRLLKGFYGTSWMVLKNRVILRGYGTFPHPNVLAAFLNLVIILLLFNKIIWKNVKSNIFLRAGIILISTFGIILTFSRTGLIVLMATLVLKTILIMKSKIKFNGIIILLRERVLNLFDGGDVSLKERIDLAKISLKILKNNLIAGVGWGNTIKGMESIPPLNSTGNLLFEPVHNIFLLILAENGLFFGIPILLSLFYLILINLVKNFKTQKIFLMFSLFIWFCIGANFDHYFLTLPQGISLFTIFIFIQFLIGLKDNLKVI